MAPSKDPSQLFPATLHRLLTETEGNGFNDIISWVNVNGIDAFQIHDKAQFERRVITQYFKTAHYKSFQRNLNLWGYRNMHGKVATYYNRKFIPGRPDLCLTISRDSTKKTYFRPQDGSRNNEKIHASVQFRNDIHPQQPSGRLAINSAKLPKNAVMAVAKLSTCNDEAKLPIDNDNTQQHGYSRMQQTLNASDPPLPFSFPSSSSSKSHQRNMGSYDPQQIQKSEVSRSGVIDEIIGTFFRNEDTKDKRYEY